MPAVKRTEIRFLLDRSGSMAGWRKPVAGGVNDYLQTVARDKRGRDARIVLVTFDSMGFDIIRRGVVSEVKPLGENEFVPRALTPLCDAVASMLNDNVEPDVTYVDVILTDGLENDSKKYDIPRARKLIEQRQREGHIVLYLGANVNAWEQAEQFGIPKERAMNVHVQGTNAPQKRGFRRFFGGGSGGNPVSMGLVAAAGLGLALSLMRPHEAASSKLGFTEADRNNAMGVADNWQEAVDRDVGSFNEPFDSIFDLPQELQQQVAELPADFDPALGSMNADGEQTGGFNSEGDVESSGDVPSTGGDDSDDGKPLDEDDWKVDTSPASESSRQPEPDYRPAREPEPTPEPARHEPEPVNTDNGGGWGGGGGSSNDWGGGSTGGGSTDFGFDGD